MSSERAYGSWDSPWTAEHISSSVIKLSHCMLDSGKVYWLEGRPSEGGRGVVVCREPDGTTYDVTPAGYNVRTRVHEYGGGAYTVLDDVVYFSNNVDNGIWKQVVGQAPEKVIVLEDSRFADFAVDKTRNRLLVVKEQHAEGGEPINSLDFVMLDGTGRTEALLMGSDFFSSPRISPDGRLLTWMSWNHPNMPWDESTLWTANIGSDGFLTNIQKVAGGHNESVFYPQWSPDGTLLFVSDQSGWWNLYASYSGLVEPVIEMEAEFGYPHWVFGWSTFAPADAKTVYCAVNRKGIWNLAVVNPQEQTLRWVDCPLTDLSFLHCDANQLVFAGGSPQQANSICLMNRETEKIEVLRSSTTVNVDSGYISKAEAIEFDTAGGARSYGFYYPPANKDFHGPSDSKPPLLVKSHGGPTAACTTTLNPGIQYWTSRGFAVVDVNYRGSTGYGRKYREELNGQWGIADVDDCESAAKFLTQSGRADQARTCITGGSAGGYTTLCALTFRKTFKAGASHYGVSDLQALAEDTHKFESLYLERLVGRWPEQKDIYVNRSPVNFPTAITCPVIFFQGLEDKVVPPSQSEMMVNALRKSRIPVVYMTFEGEQHGFRKSDSIKRSLDAELQFYCMIFGITRNDFAEKLEIENFTPATV